MGRDEEREGKRREERDRTEDRNGKRILGREGKEEYSIRYIIIVYV